MPSEEELMGLAAHMGMLRVLFQSNSPDVITHSHQHSGITVADQDDWASEKKTRKLTSKQKLFFFHLDSFYSIYTSQVLKSNCTPPVLSSILCPGDNLFQLIGKFCVRPPCAKHQPITNDIDMLSMDSASIHCYSSQNRKSTAAAVFRNS